MISTPRTIRETLIFSLPFLFFFTLFLGYFADTIFFWDTVAQASKRGSFYYENNFQHLILSSDLDSGHPPFFNMFIALGWKLFGRTVEVSHWSMLPFVLGAIYQLARLILNVFPKKWQLWVMLIAVADTTFLAQSILISPDVVMIFGFLLSVNAIWERKPWQLFLGVMLLPFVSIRGIVLAGIVFAIHFLHSINSHPLKKDFFKTIFKAINTPKKILHLTLPFLPAAILLMIYMTIHFLHTGWWISTPNPAWADYREPNSFYNFIRNTGLIGWRFLDNGRIICSLLLVFFSYKLFKKEIKSNLKISYLSNVFWSFLVIIGAFFIIFYILINNRYLLPAFLFLHLLVSYLVIHYFKKESTKKGILAAIFILLLSGTFWVYPKHIAQGWDGTLAHLPYYELRKEMIDFIEKKEIPYEIVGTEFPNKGAFDFYDLSDRKEGFAEKNFEENDYMFYSNVMNDFSDDEISTLDNEWEIVHEISSVQVFVTLYKRRE